MPRIQANRDSIDDRFSVLGFTVRTESPLFEVAVATDPQLFRPENRGRRARANFYSSRAQGVIRARRGEAVYLLPPDVLGNFIGQPRLYFGLATYRESTRGAPDFVQAPTDGSMYIGIGQLTERGLRRSAVSLPGSSYGQGPGHDPSLEWGGDTVRAAGPAPAKAATPAGNAAASPGVAVAVGYDDGFGDFPRADPQSAEKPPLSAAQEVLLRAYDGDLLSQLRLFAETVQWIAGVADTRALPHSAICHLLLYNAQGLRGRATGFYIGPKMLMTNAHVVTGTTRMVVIPGKNGAGTGTTNEPFGRFSVDLTPATSRPHPRYDPVVRGRAFDMALVKLPTAAPHGQWLSPVEELTQSRPEGVAVCGYSAHSRRGDLVATIVHATLDPEKQHVHRGYVRTVADEAFTYDVQELAGSSGSPVYWIEGGTRPRVHVVGVNAGPNDDTTNEGSRITPAKLQWIRSVAAEWGQGSLTPALQYEAGAEAAALAQALDPGSAGDSGDEVPGTGQATVAQVPAKALIIGPDDVAQAQRYAPEWRDLFNWTAPASIASALTARGMSIQRLQDATGALNLDRYQVRITRLPTGYTAQSLLQQVRTHINEFVDTRNSEFIPYDAATDGTRWASASPLGAVLKIDIFGPDNAAVVCSLAEPNRWRFTTVTTPWSGAHPVSGHREFGVRDDGGVTVFFTRAADRSTHGLGETAVWLGADHLWTSLQTRLAAWVNANGGAASVVPKFSERFHPEVVRILYGASSAAQALGQGSGSGSGSGEAVSLPNPPANIIQQPLEADKPPEEATTEGQEATVSHAQAAPVLVPIAAAVVGASFTRLLNNVGDVSWELDQMSGLKHPNDVAPSPLPAFDDGPLVRLVDWPSSGGLIDSISAGFEVRWQHNGQSLGNVQISNVTSNDAIGWGLTVQAQIMNDSIVYPRNAPRFAALRIRFDYRFTRDIGADVLAWRELHLFGNGTYNLTGGWTQ